MDLLQAIIRNVVGELRLEKVCGFGFFACGILMSGCGEPSNFNPQISGPRTALFAVGVENTISLLASDPDGDRLSYRVEFEQTLPPELTSSASFIETSAGATFQWSVGGEAADLVGTTHVIRFVVQDEKGGMAMHRTEIAIVDPVRFAARGARLLRPLPDAYLSESPCISPVALDLDTGGLPSELIMLHLEHLPTHCISESCDSSLMKQEGQSSLINWCASMDLLMRSPDQELKLSVGISGGEPSFQRPIGFRFLTPQSNLDCHEQTPASFEVVEAKESGGFLIFKLLLDEDAYEPMLTLLAGTGTISAGGSLHGSEAYRMKRLEGGTWRVRVPKSGSYGLLDTLTLLVTSVNMIDPCQQIITFEPVVLNVSELTSDDNLLGTSCDVCFDNSDCALGRCVIVDGFGHCGVDCATHQDCGMGHLCIAMHDAAGSIYQQCLPESGGCQSNCNSAGHSFEGIGFGTDSFDERVVELCGSTSSRGTFKVKSGDGVRISVSEEKSEQQSLGVGVSVWLTGVERTQVWHSDFGQEFELLCAREDLEATFDIWRWSGTEIHRVTFEKVFGGCPIRCEADRFESERRILDLNTLERVEGLSLCELDSDAFDAYDLIRNPATFTVAGFDPTLRMDVRLLSLSTFDVVYRGQLEVGRELDLSQFGEDGVRIILSSQGHQTIERYSAALSFDGR